ncbi:MAG: hypothetical protein IPP59_08065 [Betaproteobacteria bacterium]|jgi:hypothetical protein|nr:hypothetical protein [Betaproteobacteria bacterium]MBK9784126.1 hypothetical protein [Candidatus Dechloromonas phosphorivorans]
MSNKLLTLFEPAGKNTVLCESVRFFAGGGIGNDTGAASAREWRRAQARDKRRAEGAERVKAALKKRAVKK